VASGFAEYYTTESLFDPPNPADQPDLNDPYYILGVSRHAEWREIVIAHRNLCKAFHPDRFAGQPSEVIARADENIRRINVAYAELNRRIQADAVDRSSD
jgi:DnaJ-class molecular chaperone